jgi:5-formyltetrahydrofolate cyclo-ligase
MVSRSKDTVREESISARAARNSAEISAADLATANHNWATLCPGQLITCFVSMATEPPTTHLRKKLHELGKDVALPIMKPEYSLAWGFDGDELVKNSYGIHEPVVADIEISGASAIIIPALRVGRDGSRLGRGAGYYDRALANVPTYALGGPLRICLVFDDEVDGTVPSEEHDAIIDLIVTPSQILPVSEILFS